MISNQSPSLLTCLYNREHGNEDFKTPSPISILSDGDKETPLSEARTVKYRDCDYYDDEGTVKCNISPCDSSPCISSVVSSLDNELDFSSSSSSPELDTDETIKSYLDLHFHHPCMINAKDIYEIICNGK